MFFPKLKNETTGAVIEINDYPFTIGRALNCKYIIPSKTISRVHCIIDKENGSWILKDTSTNGTYVNNTLIRQQKTPPLKDKDVIALELNSSNIFVFKMHDPYHIIANERFCTIADIIHELEPLESNLNNVGAASNSNENASSEDHVNPAKTSRRVVVKRARTEEGSVDIFRIESTETESRNEEPDLLRSFSVNLVRNGDVSFHRSVNSSASANNPLDLSQRNQKDDERQVQNASGTSSSQNAVDLVQNDSVTVQENVNNAQENVEAPEEGEVDVVTVRDSEDLQNIIDTLWDGASRGASAGAGDHSENSGNIPVENVGDNLGASETETPQNTESNVAEEKLDCAKVVSSTSQSKEDVSSSPKPGPSTEMDQKTLEQNNQDHYEVMENELQCVICSELFIKSVTLNCSHSFCKHCIGTWSKNKSDCPICRQKITSTTATIVLDNVIEKVIEGSTEEIKQHRRAIVEERKRLEEAEKKPAKGRKKKNAAPAAAAAAAAQLPPQFDLPPAMPGRRVRARGGRATRRTRQQTREARLREETPRINVLDPVAINIGALTNNIIELSSDSDSSDTEDDALFNELLGDYDQDEWYGGDIYWGGYGHCFRCGSPTHWANNCPNR